MGTEPHSHPGITAPEAPATAIASDGRAGNTRRTIAGVTHAAIAPLTTVPSTRKGIAWMTTPAKIVAAVCSRALELSRSADGMASNAAATTTVTKM